MRLTTFSDYSLRVLMYLAAAPEGKATIAEIAGGFGISEHHLVKVVQRLGAEGLLINTRGRGGGVRLARAPEEINIGRVVRMTEGADRPAECFDRATNTCPIAGRCRLESALREAVASFYESLGQRTLADLRPRPKAIAALRR